MRYNFFINYICYKLHFFSKFSNAYFKTSVFDVLIGGLVSIREISGSLWDFVDLGTFESGLFNKFPNKKLALVIFKNNINIHNF